MTVTETQFNELKKRVSALEKPALEEKCAWPSRHPTAAWLISTILGVAALLVMTLFGVMPHLENDAGLRIKDDVGEALKDPLRQITQMGQDIAKINGTLAAWSPLITPQFFKKAAALPDKQFLESVPQLKAVAQVASESKAAISSEDIADVGKRLISLASARSDTAMQAWSAALDFIGYRSTLNTSRTVNTVPVAPGSQTMYETFPPIDGRPSPQLANIPLGVAPSDAARFETIGHNLNESLKFGSPQLFAKGGAISLDSKYMRHVVFQNVEIHYSGKPVMLEDVIFMNCTFVFDNTPETRQLGNALLASSPLNFQVSA